MTAFLDGLGRLEAEATPGPWSEDGSSSLDWGIRSHAGDQPVVLIGGDGYHSCRHEDAAFVAAFRNAAPLLIEVARAAEHHRCFSTPETTSREGTAFCPLCEALAALRAETERGKE